MPLRLWVCSLGLGLICLISPVGSFAGGCYSLSVKTEWITNSDQLPAFRAGLASGLRVEGLELIDPSEAGSSSLIPDYLVQSTLTLIEDKVAIATEIRSFQNSEVFYRDEVYTYDLWSTEGIYQAGRESAARLGRMMKGLRVRAYQETFDYRKRHGRMMASKNPEYPSGLGMIYILNVPLTYPGGTSLGALPLGYSFEVFQFGRVWMIGGLPIGVGVGTELLDYRSASAWTILPLQGFLCLYAFPDRYEFSRRDFYLTAEYGFFVPHTSYLELAARFYFPGLSVEVGWHYEPYVSNQFAVRPEDQYFYGGISIHFGKYWAQYPEAQ